MVTETQTIETMKCDVCGSTMTSHPESDQYQSIVVTSIVADVYYGGAKRYVDICSDCNTVLSNCLKKLQTGDSK